MKIVYRSSTKKDEDLLTYSGQNHINELFRMIGMYQKYIGEYTGTASFIQFYLAVYGENEQEFHFVNKGIQLIYPLLAREGINISKHNMRRLGRTFFGSPVVTTIYIDKIIEVCLNYIFSEIVLREAYLQSLYTDNSVACKLRFQFEFLSRLAERYQPPNAFIPLKKRLDSIEWR